MKIQSSRTFSVITSLFVIASLWFFIPVGKDFFEPRWFAMRLALPAAILVIGSIRNHPILVTLGLCFCTLGDSMGVMGSFEGQMGGFAIAQLCFTAQFIREIREAKGISSRQYTRTTAISIASALCILPLWLFSVKVFPVINDLIIRIGCTIYSLLLLATVWTSITRAFATKRFIAMVGCGFFLISDLTLAWNKFTEHIPHASLYIMTTYYSALLLIFIGTRHKH